MSHLWQDFRFALRTLRKNLSVTLIAVLSLGLAIAGNTTVYSLINSLLYRPLPYQEVERLAFVGEVNSSALPGQLTTISPANYLDLAERQSSFQQIAAYQAGSFALNDGTERPEQLTGGLVTPEFFQLLGAGLAQGRPFLAEEGVSGNNRVVILSYEFWAERLGAQQDLRHQTLKLNGELYDVVGVVEADFEWLLAANTKLWTPLVLEAGEAPRHQRDLIALGRLADGVEQTAAQAEMDTLMAQLVEDHPEANRGYSIDLMNLRYDIPDSRNKIFFRLLQVALIFVLLIACANVANLLLARSQAREREIAVRSSLGANRLRIIFQLLVESLTMAILAGILGVALGTVGMKMVGNALAGLLPSFWAPTLEPRVLAYSVGVTLAGGLLFGLAPVLQTARFDLLSALRDGTQSASMGGRRRLASNFLVVLEIAFAVAFLAGASMMISSFQTMQSSDPGFETEDMLVLQVVLPDSRYATGEGQNAGAEQVRARLESLPGVEAVAFSSLLPRTPLLPQDGYEVDRQPVAEGDNLPQAGWLNVAPEFFETLDVPLQKGRMFTEADSLDSSPVVVINEALAELHWGTEDPLGQRLTFQGESREVIGVVPSLRHEVIFRNDAPAVGYLPWKQQPSKTFAMTLHTAVEPATLAETIRREILLLDRNISVNQIQSLDSYVEQFWVGQQVFTAILGGFGTLALVLAALGTYGVLAYSVARRTHEIGIRMAIGASRNAVMKMIIRQGLGLGLIGVVFGCILSLIQVRAIGAIFEGLVPVEPRSVFTVAAGLALVTLLASAVPARRAASVDPLESLRTE